MNSLVRSAVAGLLIGSGVPGVLGLVDSAASARAADPLPSWNEGSVKKALLDFVAGVVDPSSKDYVPPAQRIATFDNDGTLWVEKPVYTQLAFIFDRVKELAPQHPEWKTTQPFQALLEGDALPDGVKPPEITFAEKGAVSGFTSVNRFTGKFTPQGETLFGPGMATTRRAGPPKAMQLESALLQAMRDVNQFKTKRDRLTFSADDLPLLIFQRVKTP